MQFEPSTLVAAAALGLAACGRSGPGPAPSTERPRVLLVGWDGATFDSIDPLLEAGRMPCLRGLIESGSSATLESTMIPISSAAWTSAMTGKGPGWTGVYSFFEPVEGSYDVRLISSRSNRAAPLWRILTAHGLHVNVVGVPVTYPPEAVRGTMIAGMLSPPEADYAHPPGTADALRARGFVPDLGVWRDDGNRTRFSWDFFEEQLALKEAIVGELLERDDWDLSIVVFKSLDVASHRLYDGRPDGDIARLLELLDGILARLVEAAGPGVDVLLMSDHGFAVYRQSFDLQAWTFEHGYAVRRDDAAPATGTAGPLAESRAIEHRRRLEQLDLPRTRVIAGACEGNFGSLWLNLVGRERAGTVAPGEADHLLEELAERLAAEPFVRRVMRGADLYPGPWGAVVPDLVFEADPAIQVVASEGAPRGSAERPFPEHALDGILVLAGPQAARLAGRGHASIFDIAPTVLHLLHRPVYEEMGGRVLEDRLHAGPPLRRVHEADDPRVESGGAESRPYTREDLETLERRLDALGYGG